MGSPGHLIVMKNEFKDLPILPRTFYEQPVETVARSLLGKILIHQRAGVVLAGRLLEIEAYLGLDDPASHAYNGLSKRNAVLYGRAGLTDVFLIYGIYDCLNISCLPDGQPGGVLLRAVEPISGIATMEKLRGLPKGASHKALTGGPGRLCQAFGISYLKHHGIDVTLPTSRITVVDDGVRPVSIQETARIGITKAVDLPLRFLAVAASAKESRWISKETTP